MPDWSLWLIAAAVLGLGEIATLSFFLGPVALAAALTAVVAVAGVPLEGQFIVFIVASIASLVFIRPVAQRHLRTPGQIRSGTDALVGCDVIVLEQVTRDGGKVKLAGEVWTARTYDEDEVFEEGERAEVVKIDGATALVHK
ncbi:MAG: NfeD family protein [Thermoleophilaceae bacterium]|nr:NfeD family protein [Thermoleophilaceae bacterium]